MKSNTHGQILFQIDSKTLHFTKGFGVVILRNLQITLEQVAIIRLAEHPQNGKMQKKLNLEQMYHGSLIQQPFSI